MKTDNSSHFQAFSFSLRDFLISVAIFLCAVIVCSVLRFTNSGDGFASPVFVLAVLLISRFTSGYLFGLTASLLGVICVNFVFTYPYLEFNFTLSGYPLSFLALLMVSLITSTLTSQTKKQDLLRLENEREKMRANLLRSVSHDIRTPLTAIVGATSTLLENPDLPPEEQQELLTDVRDDAQWLIQVVENLLSITRMGATQTQLKKIPEAAEEILGETARKFRKRYPQVTVTVSIPNELLFIPMDAILIEQVLSNLMENAVLHGKSTTHIHLQVWQEDTFGCFCVSDNGQGIASHLIPSLFDGTMRRVESPTVDGKRNMGLGLSVCQAIVHAHGGSISAENVETGAKFTFRLPL